MNEMGVRTVLYSRTRSARREFERLLRRVQAPAVSCGIHPRQFLPHEHIPPYIRYSLVESIPWPHKTSTSSCRPSDVTTYAPICPAFSSTPDTQLCFSPMCSDSLP